MRNSPNKPKPVVQLSLDLRLTTDDFALLTPSQIKAVFEGVGALAAMQHGADHVKSDDRPYLRPDTHEPHPLGAAPSPSGADRD